MKQSETESCGTDKQFRISSLCDVNGADARSASKQRMQKRQSPVGLVPWLIFSQVTTPRPDTS